jgi:hypothetical protein
MESISLPSGATAEVRPFLSRNAKGEIDNLGLRSALKTVSQMDELGIDLEKLMSRANGEAKAAQGFSRDQDDALAIHSITKWFSDGLTVEGPLTAEIWGDQDDRDCQVVVAALYELYGIETAEDSDEGKALSGGSSIPQDTPEE